MRKHKPVFGGIKIEDNSTGYVVIPKASILNSKDPDSLRHEISEEYSKAVQEHPDLEFGILVDPQSDDIRIDWTPRT